MKKVMFYSIVTLPSASTILASTTEYSSTVFSDFTIFIYAVVGIAAAALAVVWLRRSVLKGVRTAMGMGGRRGRRGRR